MLAGIYLALLRWDGLNPPVYVGLANFTRIFQGELVLVALKNNVIYAFGTVVGKMLPSLTNESGVSGLLEMAPYETSVVWRESALVAFERGYVRIDLPAPLAYARPGRVVVMRDPGKGVTPIETSPHLPSVGAMRQQAINYLQAVRGVCAPPCEAAEALEDLKIARDYLRLWKGV